MKPNVGNGGVFERDSHFEVTNFKSFEKTVLKLGGFTVLLGTNASGKSNIRDAFRFFHGVSRGYNLAEILGEKWIECGILQWRGIRGGTREAAFLNAETFALGLDLNVQDGDIQISRPDWKDSSNISRKEWSQGFSL